MKYLLFLIPLFCSAQNDSSITKALHQLDSLIKVQHSLDSMLIEKERNNNAFIIDCLYIRNDRSMFISCQRCKIKRDSGSIMIIQDTLKHE